MSKSTALVLVAVLLLAFGYGPSANADSDLFLYLPGIPGESTDSVHTNQVDVLAWSWGMRNSGLVGGTGGAGKVNIQNLSLIKYVDKASPRLMSSCAKGTVISNATLYVRQAGSNPIEYIKIQFTNVLVTSVSAAGSGGEDRLTENVSLAFATVQFDYVPTKLDGSAGTDISFWWDVLNNFGTIQNADLGLTVTLTYTNGAPLATLTWNSIAGSSYQVLATTNLNGPWQPYASPIISAETGITSTNVPANDIKMFFRVQQL